MYATETEYLIQMFAAARAVDDSYTLDSHESWEKSEIAPSTDWAESWIRY